MELQTRCRVARFASFRASPRYTRECRIPRDLDSCLHCTGHTVMSNTALIPPTNSVQHASHRSQCRVGGSGNRLSRQQSDVSCHERLGGAGVTTVIDEVFYVVGDSAARALTDDGRPDASQTNSVDGRTYVCTTGTNLYRILALSDKLSTKQNAAVGDNDTPQQDTTSGGGAVQSHTPTTIEDTTLSRRNDEPHRESVRCVADETCPPRCLSHVGQHNDDNRDSSETVCDSATAARHGPALSSSLPPSVSQWHRHCSTDDGGGVRRRPPRSVSLSYRVYSSSVFHGAPKLVCYGVDDGTTATPAICRQTSATNSLPVRQTTSTSVSGHASTPRQIREPPSSLRSMRSTLAVAKDDVHDKSNQLASAICTGTYSGTVRGNCNIRRSESLNVLRHQQSRNGSSGRAQSLMMKWLRQTSIRPTADDVISSLVIDDKTTAAVTRRNEEQSFTQDDTRDTYGSTSVNDPETILRRGITSGDVTTDDVDNKRDDKMCTTYDTGEDRPRTSMTGETVSQVRQSYR